MCKHDMILTGKDYLLAYRHNGEKGNDMKAALRNLENELIMLQVALENAHCVALDQEHFYFEQDEPDADTLKTYYKDAAARQRIIIDYLDRVSAHADALEGYIKTSIDNVL